MARKKTQRKRVRRSSKKPLGVPLTATERCEACSPSDHTRHVICPECSTFYDPTNTFQFTSPRFNPLAMVV
ncbi:50S ribosomal protein L32 [Patescibacteria group bacterium]